MGTTAAEHLGTQSAASNMPSGEIKPTAKGTGTQPVRAALKDTARRRKSPGAPENVTKPLSGSPAGTTTRSQVENNVMTAGNDVKKRYTCL